MKKVSVFLGVLAISIVLLVWSPMQITSQPHSFVSKDNSNMENVNGIVEESLQIYTIKMVKNAEILGDMTGFFEYVGTAAVGQHFKIVGENDRYFYVNFGRGTGFVKKEDTVKVKAEKLVKYHNPN
ncbi:hypothetical protein [Sporosarcina sp. E16_8]|uniref:hypothetical protein n=1 Tax=Sporosarcina sp. E16_8 TaxID=2789295 RepID=UPI001A9332B4|nr:hypothetical protein [Sporosarcina sp. E16_8]MBO0586643.1 hypothetical protein [Sporosarcina sp. E16_8]